MTKDQRQTIRMKVAMASRNVDDVLHNVVPELFTEIKRLEKICKMQEVKIFQLEKIERPR